LTTPSNGACSILTFSAFCVYLVFLAPIAFQLPCSFESIDANLVIAFAMGSVSRLRIPIIAAFVILFLGAGLWSNTQGHDFHSIVSVFQRLGDAEHEELTHI
jgi:hypothetical protein